MIKALYGDKKNLFLPRVNNYINHVIKDKKRHSGFFSNLQMAILMTFSAILKACSGSNSYDGGGGGVVHNTSSSLRSDNSTIETSSTSRHIINNNTTNQDDSGKFSFKLNGESLLSSKVALHSSSLSGVDSSSLSGVDSSSLSGVDSTEQSLGAWASQTFQGPIDKSKPRQKEKKEEKEKNGDIISNFSDEVNNNKVDCRDKKDVTDNDLICPSDKKFLILENINKVKEFVGSLMKTFAHRLLECIKLLSWQKNESKEIIEINVSQEFNEKVEDELEVFSKIKLFTSSDGSVEIDINQSICKLLVGNMAKVYGVIKGCVKGAEYTSKESLIQKIWQEMITINIDSLQVEVSGNLEDENITLYSQLMKEFREELSPDNPYELPWPPSIFVGDGNHYSYE